VFRRALAVTTDNAMAWNSLGAFLLTQGEEQEAFRCFTKAATANWDNNEAWYNLGTYYARHGRHTEAWRCFTVSLRLRERPATSCHVGLALKALHRPAEADQYFAKALAMDPNYIPARLSLADDLADAGKKDEAAREYREVLRLAPNCTEARERLTALTGR
jgi:tetratricopeptide (TPR) repeat protein